MKPALVGLPLALLAVLALAGCGRVGPPRAPGPASEVTYPRAYPALDPNRLGTANPAPTTPPVPLPVPSR